jgi:hypothetical protein
VLWAANPDTLPYGTKNYAIEEGLDAGNYEKITPQDTATGITAGLLVKNGVKAKEAYITCETQDMHFMVDGTTPTPNDGTDIGHPILIGQAITIHGYTNLSQFKAINKSSGVDGTLKITLFY